MALPTCVARMKTATAGSTRTTAPGASLPCGRARASPRGRACRRLYTGAVDAPFTLKGEDNALLGQIRAAGSTSPKRRGGPFTNVDLAVSSPGGQQQPDERQRLSA